MQSVTPCPSGAGGGERRISVKHKEAAVSAFAAISLGATDRAPLLNLFLLLAA